MKAVSVVTTLRKPKLAEGDPSRAGEPNRPSLRAWGGALLRASVS